MAKVEFERAKVEVNIGGLYGINVETLGDNKTLTPGADKIYQYLDEGGADRNITLATAAATAGDRFVIRHNGAYNDAHFLQVKQGATELDKIYAGAVKEFIFDGTDWISRGIGTGESDAKDYNVTIGMGTVGHTYGTVMGYIADAHGEGVGIGYACDGYQQGVAIGANAAGFDYGVAVGYTSSSDTYGVAVGFEAGGSNYGVGIGASAYGGTYGVAVGFGADTNLKYYSIALGYKSECTRYSETSVNIDGNSAQKNNVVQGRWAGATANATPVEILCGGVADQRFTIRTSSALAFRITVVARDNVAGEVAMYTFEGVIKRDAANNTVMSACNKTAVHEDDDTWDCDVTADDTNEAVIITVTGDADNSTQWAAVLEGVETHF